MCCAVYKEAQDNCVHNQDFDMHCPLYNLTFSLF